MPLHRGFSGAWVIEGGGPGVMVHKVAHPFSGVADLPALWERLLVLEPESQETHNAHSEKHTHNNIDHGDT